MADQIASRVPEELDGERLDKVVARILDLSRSDARELIERGATVDGAAARARDRVAAGSTILTAEPVFEDELGPEPVEFGILMEDADVIVVDKPAGLVVHPGSGRTTGTLASGLLYRFPEIEGVGAAGRWGLVHRLDRDTSGALIVGRTTQGFDHLREQLRRRQIRRVYTALVEGVPDSPTGTVDAPIGRDPEQPMRQAVVRGGRPARTHFEVSEDLGQCALLAVSLETGRTHQIRVHLAAIGFPVIGDPTYGKPGGAVRSPRLFLHASTVGFRHPADDREVEVVSPLPDDLGGVLASLRGEGPD